MRPGRCKPAASRSTRSRRLLNDRFTVTGQTPWYLEPEEIQRDLDACLAFSNHERAHQGYRTKGRTPYQAFLDGIKAMRKGEVTPEAA